MSINLSEFPVLLSFKCAAEIMGTSEGKVRRLVRNRRMAAVQVGKRLMIPREAIPKFVEMNMVRPVVAEQKPSVRLMLKPKPI